MCFSLSRQFQKAYQRAKKCDTTFMLTKYWRNFILAVLKIT